jgi:hypothetical protein
LALPSRKQRFVAASVTQQETVHFATSCAIVAVISKCRIYFEKSHHALPLDCFCAGRVPAASRPTPSCPVRGCIRVAFMQHGRVGFQPYFVCLGSFRPVAATAEVQPSNLLCWIKRLGSAKRRHPTELIFFRLCSCEPERML